MKKNIGWYWLAISHFSNSGNRISDDPAWFQERQPA